MSHGIDVVKLLEEGKTVQIKPQGSSMYPMFVPGRDCAIIKKVNPGQLRIGDVVLYRRDSGILVLHRIWNITKEGVLLVGDNQTCIEGPLKINQMIGVLVSFLWKGRKVSIYNPIYLLLSRGWLILLPYRKHIKRAAGIAVRGYRFMKDQVLLHKKSTGGLGKWRK